MCGPTPTTDSNALAIAATEASQIDVSSLLYRLNDAIAEYLKPNLFDQSEPAEYISCYYLPVQAVEFVRLEFVITPPAPDYLAITREISNG